MYKIRSNKQVVIDKRNRKPFSLTQNRLKGTLKLSSLHINIDEWNLPLWLTERASRLLSFWYCRIINARQFEWVMCITWLCLQRQFHNSTRHSRKIPLHDCCNQFRLKQPLMFIRYTGGFKYYGDSFTKLLRINYASTIAFSAWTIVFEFLWLINNTLCSTWNKIQTSHSWN